MQQVIVRVQPGGRITVPKAVREALGLQIGDSVQVPIRADGSVGLVKSPASEDRPAAS